MSRPDVRELGAREEAILRRKLDHTYNFGRYPVQYEAGKLASRRRPSDKWHSIRLRPRVARSVRKS